MAKKIICGILLSIILWLAFVWCKYLFFQKDYSQEQVNTTFNKLGLQPPQFDSVHLGNKQIFYLTNNLNEQSSAEKPYLFLLNDSGKSSTFFLRYFKDTNISSNYHLIAIDRIGFGKTISEENLDYNTHINLFQKSIQNILKKEDYNNQPLNFISSGSSGMAGILAYDAVPSNHTKSFIFYPKIDPRFIASKGLSKLIISLDFLFPKGFVKKQKDFLFWDILRDEDQLKWFMKAKHSEDEIRKTEKDYKGIYFMVTNKWFENKINEITKSKNFAVEAIKRRSIYRQPTFVQEEIEKLK